MRDATVFGWERAHRSDAGVSVTGAEAMKIIQNEEGRIQVLSFGGIQYLDSEPRMGNAVSRRSGLLHLREAR
jgi:hypothetical protein